MLVKSTICIKGIWNVGKFCVFQMWYNVFFYYVGKKVGFIGTLMKICCCAHHHEQNKNNCVCRVCAKKLAFSSYIFCCGYMPQPGKVFYGLNIQESESFLEFSLQNSFKLGDSIWCFFKNVKRFQKLCSFARWVSGHFAPWSFHPQSFRPHQKSLRSIFKVTSPYTEVTLSHTGYFR